MNYKFIRSTSEYFDDADILSEECGIAQSGKDLEVVVTDESDEVVACLWVYNDDDIFDFDICVAEEHRGNKIADKLVKRALDKFTTAKEEIPGIEMQVEVVNPTMAQKLRGFGFYEINKIGELSIMSHE